MGELLRRYLKPRMPLLLANLLFVGLQVFFQTVCVMGQTKKILDVGVANGNLEYVSHEGIIMLVFTILAAMTTVASSLLSAQITGHVVCDIRSDLYKKSVSFSEQDYAHFGAATLLNREMTSPYDLQVLVINIMRTSMMAPFLIVAILISIFRMNLVLFAILLVFFLITVAFLVIFGSRAREPFEELQHKNDRISGLMKEKFSGVRSIRAFGNEKLEEDKLKAADAASFDQAIKANQRINFLSPLSMVILNWTVVLIYWAGSGQLQQGMASVSDIIMVFTYLGYFIAAMAVVPVLVNLFPRVIVSSQRILEVLDYVPAVTIGKNGDKEGINKGDVEFSHVIFGYTGASEVIADVTFTARAGKVTALIGTTGCGKTTIANLLCGLYQMNFGEILVDGKSIRELDGDYLRMNISYATQRPMIFQDTVRNNIAAYRDGCSDERVKEACDASCFSEVLEHMPQGLDTMMALGGMNISGGQRQRLSIARMLAKDAKIYILDDTFSALDAKTEETVRANVSRLLKGKTTIMVAQKISTILDADNIIVLEKGRIVGQGRHEELLASCKEYQEIFKTQYYTESASKGGEDNGEA